MTKETLTKYMMRICYGILIFFMCTILLRIFTRIVLVQYLQISDNPLINAIFFDQPELSRTDNGGTLDSSDGDSEPTEIAIDWEKLYPFTDTTEEKRETRITRLLDAGRSKADRLENMVDTMTGKLSAYATDLLIGQQYFVNAMNRTEQLTGWDIAHMDEYNAVVTLKDGRLTEYLPRIDVSNQAASVIDLKNFCEELDLEFLYIQSPYAICKTENADISGIFDFSNQNADNLLAQLQAGGVETLDMRKCLHEAGMSHADAFYRTDHHWKAETGLWAAGELARYLNDTHDFSIDTKMLAADQYTYETYPSWWLGSRGTKLTIRQVEPEDFMMIYPKYKTRLHYEIPSLGIDETGDFSITYDKKHIKTTGGFSPDNGYEAYNHGDPTVQILTNELYPDGKKIVIIKDSFTRVVCPFLACADGISEINVLDVRHFTGSVQAFIREKNPDLVIVWYNPDILNYDNNNDHLYPFEFE